MVDPQAVEDADGEFVELVNAGAAAVNLYNWQLVDGSGRSHAIAADLWIEPGDSNESLLMNLFTLQSRKAQVNPLSYGGLFS